MMIFIGVMLLLSGFITLIVSNLKKGRFSNGFWSAQGFLNILLGVVFIAAPSLMIKVFIIFIGVILLIIGLLQLAGGLGYLIRSTWAWVFLMIGLLTAGSGIFLLSNPFKSAEAILPFLGVLLMLNGFSDLFRSWKVRSQPKKYKESAVQDIPYEEV